MAKKKATGKKSADSSGATPKKATSKRATKAPAAKAPKKVKASLAPGGKHAVEQYQHRGAQRANNPPVGLVTPESDPLDPPKKTYAYDPHLDPQLGWAGKAERLSFEVPSVSLHVHERIDPRTILRAVRSNSVHPPAPGLGDPKKPGPVRQLGLFEDPEEQLPRREAIEFYKHPRGWTNRLVAGDSLLVMNSLLEKEGMAGKVQMVYLDPPYGIRYGSNFQPFVGQRDVKDGKDVDLTSEPEMLRAFRDTWELGVHSYLTYLRDRLLLARDLLTPSGSVFVQIGDANVHIVRAVMDEVFGAENFCSLIAYATTTTTTGRLIPGTNDYIAWYAKDATAAKYRQLYLLKSVGGDGGSNYTSIELPDGSRRKMSTRERQLLDPLPEGSRPFRLDNLTSPRVREGRTGFFEIEYGGQAFLPRTGEWKTHPEGISRLKQAERLGSTGTGLYYIRFIDDFPAFPINNGWADTVVAGFATNKTYVVQTNPKVIARCLLMTTDPGDLVFDPTCGSGTTALVAEQWGRRWITCDTSRIALTLAKQRLSTSTFDYYRLAEPEKGIGGGLVCKTVPHVTLKSIANNPDIMPGMTRVEIDAAIARHADQEKLVDQPLVDKTKLRVTGPFTVEAVPSVQVTPLDAIELPPADDTSIARTGATVRQDEWRVELLKTGVRGRAGQKLQFAWLEPLSANRYLHAVGETVGDEPQKVVVSFGPEHAPLEQRHVDQALDEAEKLRPKADLVLFAAFHFDPEAAKDIDETTWPGVELQKVQMNSDLSTADLKKNRASNDSFWLVGQPDVEVRRVKEGEHEGRWRVGVRGFDYYNPGKGTVESGGTERIALWMLDTDYDGRSLYPRQVFFCMAPGSEQLKRLAKTLKAEIDPERIEAYLGVESLPFEAGEFGRVAVKIVDDRGIESLRIVNLAE